jgi:hypothetical protein
MNQRIDGNRRSLLAGLALAVPALLGIAVRGAPAQPGKKLLEKKLEREKAERHPHIKAAIRELGEAKQELEHAAHDFGGHRVDAIGAVNAAIKQLNLALEHDKR